jgi:hypothetical protein
MCAKIAKVVAQPNGHCVWATESAEGEAIFFCVKCGCWATSAPKGLSVPCRGAAQKHSAGHYALQRIASGRHPIHSVAQSTAGAVPLAGQYEDEVIQSMAARLEELATEASIRKHGRKWQPPRPQIACHSGPEFWSRERQGQQEHGNAAARLEAIRTRVLAKQAESGVVTSDTANGVKAAKAEPAAESGVATPDTASGVEQLRSEASEVSRRMRPSTTPLSDARAAGEGGREAEE